MDATIEFIESIVQKTDSHMLSSNFWTCDTTTRIYKSLEERSLRYTVWLGVLS